MKKIALTLGSIAALAAPVATVVACGFKHPLLDYSIETNIRNFTGEEAGWVTHNKDSNRGMTTPDLSSFSNNSTISLVTIPGQQNDYPTPEQIEAVKNGRHNAAISISKSLETSNADAIVIVETILYRFQKITHVFSLSDAKAYFKQLAIDTSN